MKRKKYKNGANIEESVMSKVMSDDIEIRSKWHFTVVSLFLGAAFILSISIAVFFSLLLMNKLRIHGPFGFLFFGTYGTMPFFRTFPITIMIYLIISFISGLLLLKRYDISYKRSFIGISIALLSMIFILGFIFDFLNVPERIGAGRVLRKFQQERFVGNDWLIGEVVRSDNQSLIVATPDGITVRVRITPETLLPFGSLFRKGERIRAVGEWVDNQTFLAKGIGKGGLRWRDNDVVRRQRRSM